MRKLWKGLIAGSVAGGVAFMLFSRKRKPAKGLVAQSWDGVKRFTTGSAKRVRRNARDWRGFVRTGTRLYKRSRGVAKVARKWWR